MRKRLRRVHDELAFHRDRLIEDYRAAGMSQAEAERRAAIEFGHVAQFEDACRDVGSHFWDHIGRDLNYAVRTLRRQPGFLIVVVLSLALGIGANTAVFTLVYHTLLRSLPVPDAYQLVNLSTSAEREGDSSSTEAGGTETIFSYPMFRDLEREQTSFTGLAAHRTFRANLAIDGRPANVEALLVSGGYFPTLSIAPAAGRLIAPADDLTISGSPVAVLSFDAWRRRFGGDPSAVGRSINVNGHQLQIAGVAPRGFSGTTRGWNPELFVPLTMRDVMEPRTSAWINRRSYWLYLFARLKSGVSIDAASAALNGPYHRIINDVEVPLNRSMFPADLEQFKASTVTLSSGAGGQTEERLPLRPTLWLLFGLTGCVLLVACANVTNLWLVRMAGRDGEIAVRLSLGASRARVMQQLFTEAMVLALAGGICGVFVAVQVVAWLPSILPASMPIAFQLDEAALMFAVLLVGLVGLLSSVTPMLAATRRDLSLSLKNQAQPFNPRRASRFRSGLATAQVALSLLLLVTAGLFAKSLRHVNQIDLGFPVDRMVSFRVSPALNGYTPQQAREVVERLKTAVRAFPGVTGVAETTLRLLNSDNSGNTITVQGFEAGPGVDSNSLTNNVGADYFKTLGIEILAGREFTESDVRNSPKVAVVNEAFAKTFHLGSNPVGKFMGDPNGPLVVEIVGLVRDTEYSEVKDTAPPLYYRPVRQTTNAGRVNIYVRTANEPDALLTALPTLAASIDPTLPLERVRAMTDQVSENVAMDRLMAMLAVVFALLATLLAAIGLYGVLAYSVSQRRREIGLRLALGALPGHVVRLVAGQVGKMMIAGTALGLVFAWWVGRATSALLYDVSGFDGATFSAAVVILAIAGGCAAWLPAWRASRIAPADILRE